MCSAARLQFSQTALHHAVTGRHIGCARALILRGYSAVDADLARSPHTRAPLEKSCSCPWLTSHHLSPPLSPLSLRSLPLSRSLARTLLRPQAGDTALHIVCQDGGDAELLDLLLLGAPPGRLSPRNKEMQTPLHVCAEEAGEERDCGAAAACARLLVDRGADTQLQGAEEARKSVTTTASQASAL